MQLVDTNIFIDHFRGYALASVFFESLNKEDVIFSAISEAEVIAGKQCSEERKKEEILQFLGKWQKIDVNNSIAVKAGDLTREYGIELADAFVAATAIIYKAELLTRNINDFKIIKELKVRIPY